MKAVAAIILLLSISTALASHESESFLDDAIKSLKSQAAEQCAVYFKDMICDDSEQECGIYYDKKFSEENCNECQTGGFKCKSDNLITGQFLLQTCYLGECSPEGSYACSPTVSTERWLCQNYGLVNCWEVSPCATGQVCTGNEPNARCAYDTGTGNPVIEPASPAANTAFIALCPTNGVKRWDCIAAWATDLDSSRCQWTGEVGREGWRGSSAEFACKGLPDGSYRAWCGARPGTTDNCLYADRSTNYQVTGGGGGGSESCQYSSCSSSQSGNWTCYNTTHTQKCQSEDKNGDGTSAYCWSGPLGCASGQTCSNGVCSSAGTGKTAATGLSSTPNGCSPVIDGRQFSGPTVSFIWNLATGGTIEQQWIDINNASDQTPFDDCDSSSATRQCQGAPMGTANRSAIIDGADPPPKLESGQSYRWRINTRFTGDNNWYPSEVRNFTAPTCAGGGTGNVTYSGFSCTGLTCKIDYVNNAGGAIKIGFLLTNSNGRLIEPGFDTNNPVGTGTATHTFNCPGPGTYNVDVIFQNQIETNWQNRLAWTKSNERQTVQSSC